MPAEPARVQVPAVLADPLNLDGLRSIFRSAIQVNVDTVELDALTREEGLARESRTQIAEVYEALS